MNSEELSVLHLRAAFAEALASRPVVLTSPTGSATRVAQREGTELGRGVGYIVILDEFHERNASPNTSLGSS